MLKRTIGVVHNMDINTTDSSGKTALHNAVLANDLLKCTKLINCGAGLEIKNFNGYTPLHYGLLYSINLETCRLLIEAGANINKTTPGGESILHTAISHRRDEISKLLIERGADVNQSTRYGITPLHSAAIQGNNEIVSLLLKHGASVNASDNMRNTPLHHACFVSEIQVLRSLIFYGADVNKVDEHLNTPLHITSSRSNIDMSGFLIFAGANANSLNESGVSPISLHDTNSQMYLAISAMFNHVNDLYDSFNNRNINTLFNETTGCLFMRVNLYNKYFNNIGKELITTHALDKFLSQKHNNNEYYTINPPMCYLPILNIPHEFLSKELSMLYGTRSFEFIVDMYKHFWNFNIKCDADRTENISPEKAAEWDNSPIRKVFDHDENLFTMIFTYVGGDIVIEDDCSVDALGDVF